jgi:hypothetical protein
MDFAITFKSTEQLSSPLMMIMPTAIRGRSAPSHPQTIRVPYRAIPVQLPSASPELNEKLHLGAVHAQSNARRSTSVVDVAKTAADQQPFSGAASTDFASKYLCSNQCLVRRATM